MSRSKNTSTPTPTPISRSASTGEETQHDNFLNMIMLMVRTNVFSQFYWCNKSIVLMFLSCLQPNHSRLISWTPSRGIEKRISWSSTQKKLSDVRPRSVPFLTIPVAIASNRVPCLPQKARPTSVHNRVSKTKSSERPDYRMTYLFSVISLPPFPIISLSTLPRLPRFSSSCAASSTVYSVSHPVADVLASFPQVDCCVAVSGTALSS